MQLDIAEKLMNKIRSLECKHNAAIR